MFDGQHKSHLLAALIVGVVISVALQGRAPDMHAPVPLDIAALPDLPEGPGPRGAPVQTAVRAQTVELGGGFRATLMYGYALEGEVVTRREYWTDAVSAVSPLDLGIVWGRLAGGSATDAMSFRTGNRAVWYRPRPGANLPDDWEEQVTNNHLIPASDAVREALLALREGERVRLRGYLVTVTGAGMAPWSSSTRRNDNTIIGGCEIILVREVERLAGPSAS